MHKEPGPKRRVAYGIDLVGDHVTVVRSVLSRNRVTHETIVENARTTDSAWAASTPIAVDTGLGRAVVAAALPVRIGLARRLVAPFPSRRKAEKVFPSLLDIQLPFPLEECSYAFLDTRNTPERQVVTEAVATRKSDLSARLETLRGSGIDPDRLDHEGYALWTQSVDELPLEPSATRVVACIGHKTVTLCIGTGERFVAAHSTTVRLEELKSSESPIADPARRKVNRRWQQVIHAHADIIRHGELQWTWCGPGAEDETLLQKLKGFIDYPDTTFATHEEPATFLARSLASRCLKQEKLYHNFCSNEFVSTRTSQWVARQKRTTAACAAVVGLLLCVMNGAWQIHVKQQHSALQNEVQTLATRLAQMPNVPRGQEVTVVRRALQERVPQHAPFLASFQPSLANELREVLEIVARHGLLLESLDLSRQSLKLEGTSEDWNQCKRLGTTLEEQGYRVQMEIPDAGADELIHYELKGERR